MRMDLKRTFLVSALMAVLAFVAAPLFATPAFAAGATLYELTENMHIDSNGNGVIRSRIAVAALQGSANLNTPLCPSWAVTNPRAQTCTVTAVGNDSVDVYTGLGTVWGTYAVVVQGDNLYDSPEFVVQTGSFSGNIDLSRAVSGGDPLGFISNGTFSDDDGSSYSFSGTFRLPFALSPTGQRTTPLRGKNAYYLADNGMLIKVSQNELSLGYPTVRFEVTFGQ